MTTIALPERWAFDGLDLSTFAHVVRTVEGVEDLPPLRGENIPVPGISGRSVAGEDDFDERTITLILFVGSSDADGGLSESSALVQAQRNFEALSAKALQRTLGVLTRHLPDGSDRSGTARIIELSTDYPAGLEGRACRVRFVLPNPWLYGADVVDDRAIAASPTAFEIVQPGKVLTHRVVLDFTGPISNPRVTNTTTGTYVECLVTVAAGEHLVIDCAAFTAENDGVTAIGSIRHSGDRRWLLVAPGANEIEVTATSPGGSLEPTIKASSL